jgi:hypothetical protein
VTEDERVAGLVAVMPQLRIYEYQERKNVKIKHTQSTPLNQWRYIPQQQRLLYFNLHIAIALFLRPSSHTAQTEP